MGWKERLDKVQVNKQECVFYRNLLFCLETCHKVRKWSQGGRGGRGVYKCIKCKSLGLSSAKRIRF